MAFHQGLHCLLRQKSAGTEINIRVDSRLRECDNYAFFAILAQNFKFPA